ncbi:MAG: hypothetical protein COA78_04160 [Blastopirellula sp.]|nr:MAG: hypothetical protein COA78_04160 [Blastopirellula sp.]
MLFISRLLNCKRKGSHTKSLRHEEKRRASRRDAETQRGEVRSKKRYYHEGTKKRLKHRGHGEYREFDSYLILLIMFILSKEEFVTLSR